MAQNKESLRRDSFLNIHLSLNLNEESTATDAPPFEILSKDLFDFYFLEIP